jgi:ParB family chromosome partitioning protein
MATEPIDATRVHPIKLLADFFDAVASGEKSFELRYDDRGYRCGDTLILQEYAHGRYTGREITRVVTYLLCGPIFGLEKGWVAMAIATPEDAAVIFSRAEQRHAN